MKQRNKDRNCTGNKRKLYRRERELNKKKDLKLKQKTVMRGPKATTKETQIEKNTGARIN